MAVQAIARNKMRSFLTMLGIIIGVASIIAMVHLGQSATRAVTAQVASIGSNLLFVMPGTSQRGSGGVRGTAEPFEMADVEAMRREIPGIRVAPAVSRNVTVIYGNANQNVNVEGTTNEYFSVRNHALASGRMFKPEELAAGAAVCILGQTIVDDMYVN